VFNRRQDDALTLSNLAQQADDRGDARLAARLDDAAAAVASGRARPDAALAEILPVAARLGLDPDEAAR
jgi:hypothetical protein